MEMTRCPHCGAGNSAGSATCSQCGGSLRQEETEQEESSKPSTCANCKHASIYAPVGQRIRPDQVWCLERDEAVPADQVGGTCYEKAFGWRREDILD